MKVFYILTLLSLTLFVGCSKRTTSNDTTQNALETVSNTTQNAAAKGANTTQSTATTVNDSIQNIDGTVYLGNLAEANVSIYEIDKNLISKLLWKETTSSFSNSLDEIGKFDTHSSSLDDDKYYLYEIEGGYDWDGNDDGVLDQNYTVNHGTLRALVKGSTLKQTEYFTVSYVSEFIFRYMQNHIYEDDFERIEANLVKEIFDTDANDITTLLKLANQFIPSRDFDSLKGNFREFVSYMIKGIRDDAVIDLSSLVILNNVTFLDSEAGDNGIFRAELNITSMLPVGEIPVQVGLEGNESETFGSITIPEIKKGTSIYTIEIDLGSYYDEDSNKTFDISGMTDFFVKISGLDTTFTNSLELLRNAFVKFENIAFEDDENLSGVIKTDEYIDENGQITYTPERILNNLFELKVNDRNLTFLPTVAIRNYFVDKNITNLKIETTLNVDGAEYTLPVTNFNNAINIEPNSKKNIALRFDLSPNNISDIVAEMLNNIISKINTTVDLSIPPLYPIPTLEEVINQNLDAITRVVKAYSSVNATVTFILKDENGNEVDRYDHQIEMEIESKIFEAFMEKLPSIIDGSLTVESFLNSI